MSFATRFRPALLALLIGLICAPAGCALTERIGRGHLRRACSQWSPTVQTALLEAQVRLGDPGDVYVAGWTCGQIPDGPLVRIVFLRFHAIPAEVRRAVIPVIFEGGRLVDDGWGLLGRQPDRYGTRIEVAEWGPPRWRVPPGWIVQRLTPEDGD